MKTIDKIFAEIKLLPSECLEEIIIFLEHLKSKNSHETMLLSENSLAKDWLTGEEDAAWENL